MYNPSCAPSQFILLSFNLNQLTYPPRCTTESSGSETLLAVCKNISACDNIAFVLNCVALYLLPRHYTYALIVTIECMAGIRMLIKEHMILGLFVATW